LGALLGAWNVGYSASFSEGTDSRLLRAGAARLGALVCFELIDSWPFGHGYAWQYKRQGASLLVNASNLGWFHQNPWLEAQFLAMARLRAAETRLPLVLASNTGISAILSPGGDVLARSEPASMRRDSERSFPHKTRILFYNGQ
jgi:apolipoprotein N-acyltransferase